MILSAGIKKIYEGIKKSGDEKNKQELIGILEKKITESKVLSHIFGLLSEVNANANKLDNTQAAKFCKNLEEKHNKFVTENKLGKAYIMNEEKSLFEFFNINSKEVTPTKIDLFIDGYRNTIREEIVKDIVTSKKLEESKKASIRKAAELKENFSNIRASNDLETLEKKIAMAEAKAKSHKGKFRKMVDASLVSIKEDVYKDFGSAVNKMYKLSMLTELKFDGPKDFEAFEGRGTFDSFQISDLTYAKKITCEVETSENDILTITFKIPIYPIVRGDGSWIATPNRGGTQGADVVYRALYSMKRLILQNGIMRDNEVNRILDPSNAVLTVKVPGNLSKEMRAMEVIGMYSTIEIMLRYKPDILDYNQEGDTIGLDLIKNAVSKFMQTVDAILPTNTDLLPYLTPDAQIEHTASNGLGRAKTYSDKTGKNAYYKDLRSVSPEDDHNPLIVGDARLDPKHNNDDDDNDRTAINPLPQDSEYVFDSMPGHQNIGGDGFPARETDDDETDKSILAKMGHGQSAGKPKTKPTIVKKQAPVAA